MLFGGVALFGLPVEQYPADHAADGPGHAPTTPGPTPRSSPTRSPRPIEQQVNGVEGMLYMSSTCASDGSYNLTVTFEVGTNLDMAQVLVQNRVAIAMPKLPEEVQRQGVDDQEAVDEHHPGRRAHLAGRPVRQPVPQQLRHASGQGRAEPDLRRRRHHRLRRQRLRHADLARPREAQGPRPDHRGRAAARSASRTCRSPPARSASRPRRATRSSSTPSPPSAG